MMHNKHAKILLFIAAALIVSALMFSGCSKPSFEGDQPENARPKCYISNIPTEGEEYSQNPQLFWFATDEDGFISQYRYIVKKAEDINDDPMAYAENVLANGDYDDWTVIYTDSLTPGQSATSDTISLFAAADPEIYTPQYFFVQAVDNYGLPSNFTDTNETNGNIQTLAYRMYSRNNNPPETHMSVDTERIYFNLEDTTDTYGGINFSWSGSDSIDYRRSQPPFEYHWKVYGPFASREEATADPEKFVYESYDSTTNSVWIDRESAILFNLYRNQGGSDMTRSDFFLFEVKSRDDAFVPDPTPAQAVFQVVEPGFERGLLLVDNNSYIAQDFVYHGREPRFLPARDDSAIVALQTYVKSVFSQAGYPADSLFYKYVEFQPNTRGLPPFDTLFQFKYVVFFREQHRPVEVKEEVLFEPLKDYLNLGGRVMFIGWNTFSLSSTEPVMQNFAPGEFAYEYFGIQGEYNTGWNQIVQGEFGPQLGITPEEFVQAEAIVPDMPPVLPTDPEGHMTHYYVRPQYAPFIDTIITRIDTTFIIDDTVDPPDTLIDDIDTSFIYPTIKMRNTYEFTGGAEPWVSYYVKTIDAEAVYTARSVYSSKDIYGHDKREFQRLFGSSRESIDGRVVGVRKATDVYRTASFSFSFYCMPENYAVEFVRSIMDWMTAEDTR
jgi:hypothetical protein